MARPSDSPQTAAAGGFLLNVNLVFVATVASYGLGFLTAVLLARALGPEGRGVTAVYQSAVGLAFAFLSAGMPSASVYFVGRREVAPRAMVEAALSVTLAALALTAAAVGAGAVVFGGLREGDVPFWLAVLAVPALVQFRTLEATLRAQGRFGAMNVAEVALAVSVLGALAAVEAAAGLTVERAVAAWSLAPWPAVAIAYALLGPAGWPRGLAGAGLLGRTVRFGAQSQLSNLLQLLNYRIDAYLVLWLVNAAGVGLYSVGVSLSEGLWFIANSVAVVLLTDLTSGGEELAARRTPLVCRNTLLVTALASLAAAAVSPLVVPGVFGADFDGAVVPFLCLLPGTTALAGGKVLSAYIFSRGRPLTNARIALLTLGVTVAADLVLIPPLEVTGAAIGASVAYCVSLALSAVAYRRLSGGGIWEALLPRLGDARLYVEGARSLLAKSPLARATRRARLGENP